MGSQDAYDELDRQYAVPPAPPTRLEYRGLPLDLIEDLPDNSPAWRQAQRITHAPKTEFSGRPLTPLHKGHVGLRCTSGLLNGVFGSAGDRRVAYWESVKVVDRIEEEGEHADTTVVREKERFSQRLTLLYADGRIELLSERPAPNNNGDTRDEERTPANGQADLCAPDAGHDDERLDSPHRLVAERAPEPHAPAQLHLVSVFGGDQEMGATIAAALEGLRFHIAVGGEEFMGGLGEKPAIYRSSLQIPGWKRPVRHILLLARELMETTLGANGDARRTALFDEQEVTGQK